MGFSRLIPAAFALSILAACTPGTTKFTVEDESSSSSSSSSQQSAAPSSEAVTANVSYIGTMEQAGISIYMQGTHRLTLPDGRFVLLESSTVNLSDAIGKRAEVFGAVRPTVEAGGIIMNVERLTILEEATSSVSSEASSAVFSNASHEAFSSTTNVPVASSVVSSVTPQSSAVSAMVMDESASSMTITSNITARAEAMSAEDLSADRWTQQYCSSHIGFCLPIHKNWWFKSFGTTASALWHVEISDAPIDAIGSGPIVVAVRSGTVESRKAVDGQVRVQGDLVSGFRSWTEGRYFEISAPRTLEGAVQYITKNLSVYESE